MKFFIFGDSICFGQLISPHKTWITKLSERLSNLTISPDPVLIQNASVNGSTTRQALERMSFDIVSHRPDILLVQFGMNDCNYWQTDFGSPRVGKRSFEANLHEILERAEKCGVKHSFLGTNHPSQKGEFSNVKGLTHSQSNEDYNQIIRKVVNDYDSELSSVTLVDNENYWKTNLKVRKDISLDDLLLADGIHLSELGHQLYDEYAGNLIYDHFKRSLR